MNAIGKRLEMLMQNNFACITFLFLFCFASFGLPLLSGLPSGYDMVTDIRFASALKDAAVAGDFFPGWANDNFGFGSIGVRFYPPVAFYLLAFTEMLGANWFWTLWANLLFWMFLGSVGIFLFVKEWGAPSHGLIAGIGYAIVPQHLSEVFQFFLFAEFAAWGVIPFCFLFVTRICRKQKWIDVILFSISYSLLILTHLPTTIIVSLCLPIYVLVVMNWQRYLAIFSRLSIAILLTITATSFRWVTMITEFDWLAHNDPRWANGFYQYATWLFPNTLTSRNQFLYVLSSWLFDLSIVMTAALLVPAIVYLLKTRTEKSSDVWRIVAASAGITGFAFFMLSRPSQFVWDALPLLQKLQFPWRWLSILSFASVVAFSLSVPRLLNLVKGRERFVAYPALGLVVTIILFNITQIIIPSAPIPVAKFSKVEQQVAEEPMFEGWWPVWAKAKAFEENREISAGGRHVDAASGNGGRKTVTIAAGEPATLTLPIFYYPHWKATVNGAPAEVSRNDNGVIAMSIGEGPSIVSVYFEEPLQNVLTRWVSSGMWVLFALVLLASSIRLPHLSRKPVFEHQFE